MGMGGAYLEPPPPLFTPEGEQIVTPPPPMHHRGKCSVTLLNETDILGQYLEKEVRPAPPKFLHWGGSCAPRNASKPLFLCPPPFPGLLLLLVGV